MFRILENETIQCWPTPMLVEHETVPKEVNDGLARQILLDSRTRSGSKASNAKAWQSPSDFFLNESADVNYLRQRIALATEKLNRIFGVSGEEDYQQRAEGWAVVYRTTDHHDIHIHQGTTWSGVYYVQTSDFSDEKAVGGEIQFLDPRWGISGNVSDDDNGLVTIIPSAGTLLMFPGWLQHWVRPHLGVNERISIAFNVFYEPR